MTDPQHEKVTKFCESCAKVEAVLKRNQRQLVEVVDKADRKVAVELLVNSCEEAMTKAFGKHEELYFFLEKTTDPNALKNDLENRLVENDEILKKDREYNTGPPETEKTSVFR